jgi:hypothetical protein
LAEWPPCVGAAKPETEETPSGKAGLTPGLSVLVHPNPLRQTDIAERPDNSVLAQNGVMV